MELYSDEFYMKKALQEAEEAFEKGEIPVGAIIVSNQKIIAKSHNGIEQLTDVTAHAEMIAITSASNYLHGKYLYDCTLYVTLEPCVMCAGALYWSRIKRVVVGARDDVRGFQKAGVCLHPKTQIEFGLMEKECSTLIQHFFSLKR